MKSLKYKILLALVLMAAAFSVNADPGDPGNLGPTPSTPPSGVPVDGGVSLLLAAGGSYAIKRLKKKRGQSFKR